MEKAPFEEEEEEEERRRSAKKRRRRFKTHKTIIKCRKRKAKAGKTDDEGRTIQKIRES